MQKFLITSALPYVNGTKHLGNLAGSMLPADVYARFLRQTGRDAVFICATDDHGTPTEIAAIEEGLPTDVYAEKMYNAQKAIYEKFGLSFDHFGRTSRQQNIELTQHMATKIVENGYTEVRTIRQLYSIDDARYLPDRYVTGTCPHCGYDKARGDQCENCTKVLDPEELISPRSTISGSSNLEFRETKHLFLNLPALSDKVRAWVELHGAQNMAQVGAGSNITQGMFGAYNWANLQNTGAATYVYGTYNRVSGDATSSPSRMYGSYSQISGPASWMYGNYNMVSSIYSHSDLYGSYNYIGHSGTGQSADAIAVYAYHDLTGTSKASNIYGLKSFIQSTSTETSYNAYGLYSDINNTGNTISSYYGLYIANEGTGNANWYSIYTGTLKSYFGGKVGIGNSAPKAMLDVTGFAKLSTNSSAPATCDSTMKGSIALTNAAKICACNGSAWIFADQTGAACSW